MAVREIGLIQHRQGVASEVPDSLENGEIGFITDTGEAVIGAPNNPLVRGRERAEGNQYPYQNVQILTEFSDNLEIIKHSYTGNSSTQPVFPTIITGFAVPTALSPGETIDLNTNIIDLTTGPLPGTGLDNAISAINAAAVPGLFAVNANGFLRLISVNGTDISLVNVSGTPLQKLGIAPIGETGVNYPANSIISRELQKVFDDRISIKAFGAEGNGTQDDAEVINAALIALYTVSAAAEDRKAVFFPAGEYLLGDNSVHIPPRAKIIGEGIDRTIFKKDASVDKPVIRTMDGNGFYDTLLAFGTNSATQPGDIVIEDMTFENMNDSDVAVMTGATRITFRRCKFTSSGTSGILFRAPTGGGYSTQENINFENCYFESASQGIVFDSVGNDIHIHDCEFTGIINENILFGGSLGNSPTESIIDKCYFKNTATTGLKVVSIGEFADSIRMVNNRFSIATNVQEVVNSSSSSSSDHRQETESIANTSTLLFESFPLGTTTDSVIAIDYVISSINNPRSGTVTVFYDASQPATTALTVNDSNPDATAVFSAVMSNPAGSAEVSLENASTGANLTLRYSYRYNT